MKSSFTLSRFTHECPRWWINFLQSLPYTSSDLPYSSLVSKNLKKWNAIYLDQVTSTPTLMFDTEKDATMFILRWS